MPARSSVSSETLPNAAHTRACTDSMPWQLGPTTRTPLSASGALQLVLQLAALGPVSRKPAVSTTAKGMPALPQSRMACAHAGAGTATTARSHGASMRHGVGIALEAVHLRILGIDGKDAALVAGGLQRLDRVAADAGEVGRGADDGDAARMEKTLEAQGQPLPRDPLPKANNKSPLPSSIFLRKSSVLGSVRNTKGAP